uniref:Carboxypeptidase n=1 Tax=uncultured microorganism TaxID=358574 RepID=A0A0B4ZN57_9ZZZZ|nr:carboxypeptidase [uncultured microorganism]
MDEAYAQRLDSILKPYFEPYSIYEFRKGGAGADLSPLDKQSILLAGLRPESQRYFDYHHSALDNISSVHPRELALGAAAMAALIYLVDQLDLGYPQP